MTAALGDPVFWRTCYSVYPCDTRYATDAGSDIMQTASLDAARRALGVVGFENGALAVAGVLARHLQAVGRDLDGVLEHELVAPQVLGLRVLDLTQPLEVGGLTGQQRDIGLVEVDVVE